MWHKSLKIKPEAMDTDDKMIYLHIIGEETVLFNCEENENSVLIIAHWHYCNIL